MPDTITVLIADDHPVFRFGMRALLEAEEGFGVAGEAQTGAEALALTAELKPAVVLMDINMPDMNGIEATREIVNQGGDTAVLILTMFDDDTVFSAMRAGARGYLLKGAEGEETLNAIRTVAGGGVIFSPGIAERMMGYFAAGPPADEIMDPFPDLTPREREILELIAAGYTNNAIAEKLVLSPKTIRNQASIIFSKLQVASRVEAILKARDAGLGDQI
jgi:DNA-binding NarL/FixJ family response regulator